MTEIKNVRPVAPVGTLAVLLWCALTAGVLEGLFRLGQVAFFGKTIGMSPHVIWMAPLANLVWVGVPVVLIGVAGKLLDRRYQKAQLFIAFWIAVLSLVLLYQNLSKVAALLLSAGVAWQMASRLYQSPRFGTVVRRSLPLLVIAPILGGLSITGSRWKMEQDLTANAPPVRAGQPNILLIIWDTVRGQNLSAYGYDRSTTPFLDRLANEGTRFELALATAPWTLPSHGSMFTGRWPSELKSRLRTPLTDSFPRIAEAFGAEGYATGGFVANLAYCSREHGLHRGFQHYEDYQVSIGRILLTSRLGRVLQDLPELRRLLRYYELPGRKTAEDVNQGFLRWVDDREGRPFFAFLNYFDGHQPYIPPEPFRSRFQTREGESYRPTMVETRFDQVTVDEIRWSMEQYDGTIAYLDSALADLIGSLRDRGLLDNTVVVVTSDHGEHFGEHERLSHANSLYRQLLQVPLVFRFPGKVPRSVVAPPVSLRDLPQTMLHLAGIEDRWGFPGASLARFWSHSDSAPESGPIVSQMYSMTGPKAFSVVADGYHLVKWFGRPVEIYHLANDPKEEADLFSTPEGAAVGARLHEIGEHIYLRQ